MTTPGTTEEDTLAAMTADPITRSATSTNMATNRSDASMKVSTDEPTSTRQKTVRKQETMPGSLPELDELDFQLTSEDEEEESVGGPVDSGENMEEHGVPATSEDKQESVPATPQDKYEAVPATPQGKNEPVPATQEKQETVLATPQEEHGSVPATPQDKHEAVPATPQEELRSMPAIPQGEHESKPVTPQEKHEPAPATLREKHESVPATPQAINPNQIIIEQADLVAHFPEEDGTEEPAQSLTQSIKNKAKQAVASVIGSSSTKDRKDDSQDVQGEDKNVDTTTSMTANDASLPPPDIPENDNLGISKQGHIQEHKDSDGEVEKPPQESRLGLKQYFMSTQAPAAKARSPEEAHKPRNRDSGKYLLESDAPPDSLASNSESASDQRSSRPHAPKSSDPQRNKITRQPSAAYSHSGPDVQTPRTDVPTPATDRSCNRGQEASHADTSEREIHVSFPNARKESNVATPEAAATKTAYEKAVRLIIGGTDTDAASAATPTPNFSEPIIPLTQDDQPSVQPTKSPVVPIYRHHYADDDDDISESVVATAGETPDERQEEEIQLREVPSEGYYPEQQGDEMLQAYSPVFTAPEDGSQLRQVPSSVYSVPESGAVDIDGFAEVNENNLNIGKDRRLAEQGATAALHEADFEHGGTRKSGNVGGLEVLDTDGERRGRTSEWAEGRNFSWTGSEGVPELKLMETTTESDVLPFPRGSHQYSAAVGAYLKPSVRVPPILSKGQECTATSAAAAAIHNHHPVEVFRVTPQYFNSHFAHSPVLKTTLDNSKQFPSARLSKHEWNDSQNAASAALHLGKFTPTKEEQAVHDEERARNYALEEERRNSRSSNILRAATIAHHGSVPEDYDEVQREDHVGLTGARIAAMNAPSHEPAMNGTLRGDALRAAVANHNMLMEAARARARNKMQMIDKSVFEKELYGPRKEVTPSAQESAQLLAQKRAAERESSMIPEGCVNIGGGGYVQNELLDRIARERLAPMLNEINDDAEERRAIELARRLDKAEEKRRRDASRQRRRELEMELKAAKKRDKASKNTSKSTRTAPSTTVPTTTNTPTRALTAQTPATRTSNTAIHQPSEIMSRMSTPSFFMTSEVSEPLPTSESPRNSTSMADALRLGNVATPPRRSMGHVLRRFFLYRYHDGEPLICTPPAAYRKPVKNEQPANEDASEVAPSNSATTKVEPVPDSFEEPLSGPSNIQTNQPEQNLVPSTKSVRSAPLVSTSTQQKLSELENLHKTSSIPHLTTRTSAGAAAIANLDAQGARSDYPSATASEVAITECSSDYASARAQPSSKSLQSSGSGSSNRGDSGKANKDGGEGERGTMPGLREFTDRYADALRSKAKHRKEEEDGGGEARRVVVLNKGPVEG